MSVITLSRQIGSLGDEVARLLCERLGMQRFDKSVMTELGQELGMAPAVIAQAVADRRPAKGLLERWFGNYQDPLGDPSGWTFGARSDAFEGISVANLIRLIHAGYDRGNVVIVGRGGMAALQDKRDVLHVRVLAPKELRIKRVQQSENVTLEEARKRVEARDASDVEWIHRYFDLDAHDPQLFDLVINTAKIAPAEAVDLIVKALAVMQARS